MKDLIQISEEENQVLDINSQSTDIKEEKSDESILTKGFVEVNGLNKMYGRKKVLDNFDLKLEKGKIYGLFAPNGEGKTTLLKMLAGVNNVNSGLIRVDGETDIVKRKKQIAYMSDHPSFLSWMTITDIEQMYIDFFEDFNQEKFSLFMDNIKIEKNKKFSSLSKGQKEQIYCGLTMSRDASVFLLDEPFGGIDILLQEKILQLILQNYSTDSTVVITTHYPSEMQYIFDEVIFFKDSKIVYQNTMEEISFAGKTLVDVYREVYSNV
ncbi:MAG: ATP-binding cassette domain-containing protein [Mycoplasmatales bacterium]